MLAASAAALLGTYVRTRSDPQLNGHNLKRHATLRADAVKVEAKMVRIPLHADRRESTWIDWFWAAGGQ